MTNFYVSATGSDTADGLSASSAFATLDRAQEAMRATAGDDTALVSGGTYVLKQTLVLTDADAGSHFQATGPTPVVLSGGTAMTGWTKGTDGIWTAHLDQSDLHQLTLNGDRMTEARYPNEVPTDPHGGGWLWARDLPAGVDPQSHMAMKAADLAASGLKAGMQIHLFTNATWASDTLTVTAIDKATGVVTFDRPADYPLGPETRYFVEGGKVQLDKPGEWWFDAATGTVNFKAPPGFDGKGVVASGNHSLISLEGTDHVSISGFTLSDVGTEAYNADISEAGIVVRGSHDNTISGNHFVNLPQGVHLTEGSHDNLITNNRLEHLLASAIFADYGASANTISGNDIQWIGEEFVGNGAIQLNEALGNLIAHNVIRDVPRMGIALGNFDQNLTSGNNIIEWNTVLRSMQETADGGAIYEWCGADRTALGDIFRYNRIIDAGGLEPLAGGGGFKPGHEYSNGIYLDDYTSHAQVYGNMIDGSVRGGIYLHGGSYNSVHDNIVLGNKDIGIQFFQIGEQMVGNQVFHNIVQATTDPNGNTVEANPAFVAPGTFHDNFYWNPTGGTLNFWYDTFAVWQAMGYDLRSTIFNGALFVDPATGDYHLRPGSLPLLNGFHALPLEQMGLFHGGRIVLGSAKADTLQSGIKNDVLEGFQSNDRLNGAAGRDDMNGGNGADRLTGGAGADSLTGGLGADVFIYTAANDSALARARDVITDFSHGSDKIDLTALDASSLPGHQALHYLGTAAFDDTPGALRLMIRGGFMILSGDMTGDGIADFSIQINGTSPLALSDFLL